MSAMVCESFTHEYRWFSVSSQPPPVGAGERDVRWKGVAWRYRLKICGWEENQKHTNAMPERESVLDVFAGAAPTVAVHA